LNLSSPELERALLACAFHNADAREGLIAEGVTPALLTGRRERIALDAIFRLHGEGCDVSVLTVLARVPQDSGIDIFYLNLLDVDLHDFRRVGVYLDKLRELSIRRQVIDLASLAKVSMAEESADAGKVLAKLRVDLMAVEEQGFRPDDDWDMTQTYARMDALLDRAPSEILGLPTGLADLDRALMGLEAGRVYVPCARPGIGKSVLAINVAKHTAQRGHAVAFFSLEMTRQQIVNRMVADICSIDLRRVRSAMLSPAQKGEIRQCQREMKAWPMRVIDKGSLRLAELAAGCRRVRREFGRLDLVVVDYLTLLRADEKTDTRHEEVATISRGLKAMAKEFDVAVLALSQLNREPAKRGNFRPRLEDLRESGQVEQDADVVIGIYRDEYYHPENIEAKGEAEFILLKNRDGEVGIIKARFDGAYQRFRSLAAPADYSRFNDEAYQRPMPVYTGMPL
jgi:replicative DNA helicase